MNVIATERLILQPFSPEDAEEYFSILDDPEIHEYLPYAYSRSFDTIEQRVRDYSQGDFQNAFFFEIFERKLGRIIGAILGISNNSDKINVSYFIASEFRNKGYMTEALEGFIKYLQNDSNLCYSHLRLEIKNENIPSIKVAKKVGGMVFRKSEISRIWYIKL